MFDKSTEPNKKNIHAKPIKHTAIQKMVNDIVQAWGNRGTIRLAFDPDKPTNKEDETARDVRYAALGTLLMFRCRPELQHYDNRGMPKEPNNTKSLRGTRGKKWVRNTNSPKFYVEFAMPQEYEYIRWTFVNPIGSYALPKGARFSSKSFSEMVKQMGYVVDDYNPNPDNSRNNVFKANWRRLLSDHFPGAVSYFDAMTSRNPDEPFFISYPGIHIPHETVSQEAIGNEFVYVLIEVENNAPSGYCKVGFSAQQDLNQRKKNLQTGNPRTPEYVRLFKGGRELEKIFHRKLSHAQTAGGGMEWFHYATATNIIEQDILKKQTFQPLLVKKVSDAIPIGTHPYFLGEA